MVGVLTAGPPGTAFLSNANGYFERFSTGRDAPALRQAGTPAATAFLRPALAVAP